MTSTTQANASKLIERNGSVLPKPTPKAKAKAPAKAPAQPTPVACNCGCGAMANLGRAYKPGHDARHAGEVGRKLAAGTEGAQAELDALPTKLADKARKFAENRAKEAKTKAAAAAIRAKAKADLAEAIAAL